MEPVINLLLKLYPQDFAAEFGDEMRLVFDESASVHGVAAEIAGLILGAIREQCHARVRPRAIVSMGAGALLAFGSQLLMYRSFLGIVRTALPLLMFCALVRAQPETPQDPAVLETAKAIYRNAFSSLHNAKGPNDIEKLMNSLDSPDWISVDRFGRTILNRKQAELAMQSILTVPPESRTARMDIIWAERSANQLIVVAWMGHTESDNADAVGKYGPKGASHRFTRATLVRDIFELNVGGWRRIRHDKLLPDATLLAVDGVPVSERNRVTEAP